MQCSSLLLVEFSFISSPQQKEKHSTRVQKGSVIFIIPWSRFGGNIGQAHHHVIDSTLFLALLRWLAAVITKCVSVLTLKCTKRVFDFSISKYWICLLFNVFKNLEFPVINFFFFYLTEHFSFPVTKLME